MDHSQHAGHAAHMTHNQHGVHIHGDATTPVSIMGSHIHDKGDWMISYRYMHMAMDGNRDGTDSLSPTEISGDFANVTGVGPATLRIVPTEMTMDMHMLGAMYGLTDRLTLMGMVNYLSKEMDHITFAGMNPDLEIGRFTTQTNGFGDTKIAGLYDLYSNGVHSFIAKAGVSLPTGSIEERGVALNPMGMRQDIRLPYAMQLGSGTFDLEPALTYSGHNGALGWGAQYSGQIRLGENNQDYTLGDKHKVSAWGGYQFHKNFAATARVTAEHEGKIDGNDDRIAGPVQTANPDYYGGDRVEAALGLNFVGDAKYSAHSFGAEFSLPVYQDLNGPQMERDYGLTLNYRLTF